MKTNIILVVIFVYIDNWVWCIWPPSYNVNLKYEEVFVVDEPLEQAEIQEVYDEEILNDNDRAHIKVEPNKEKFYRIHNAFKLETNNIYKTTYEKKKQVFEESYPNYEEPSDAGFVGDDEKSSMEVALQKRQGNDKDNPDLSNDYNSLKEEFEKNIKEMKKMNKSLNYVETTKAPQGFLKSLISPNVNASINCSESGKYGIPAIQCLVSDLGKPQLRNKALDKLMRFILVWIFVYLIIAIPLWCQYGWCCCCCRCKFCRPREEIEMVKKFFVENPNGVYNDPKGQKHEYTPTAYEKYAYKKLAQALQNL